jgi:hypothetical protein
MKEAELTGQLLSKYMGLYAESADLILGILLDSSAKDLYISIISSRFLKWEVVMSSIRERTLFLFARIVTQCFTGADRP